MWAIAGFVLFLMLAAVGVYGWKWLQQHKGGPEEFRVRSGNIRLPPEVMKSATRLWILITIGVLIVGAWYVYMLTHAYYGIVLLSGGKTITATVTQGGGLKDDCHYCFEVDRKKYRGRGPRSLRSGDEVTVMYSTDDPSINRPANGLHSDVIWGGALSLVIVFGIVIMIPTRRLHPYPSPQAIAVADNLGSRNFAAAADVVSRVHELDRTQEILGLAEGIVFACQENPSSAAYEEALLAIDILAHQSDDSVTLNELSFFRLELERCSEAWAKYQTRQERGRTASRRVQS